MATVVWKFVDTPVASPTTLLDMNQPGTIMLDLSKDFDMSPPQKRRNYAPNMMTEGSLITHDAYENRILTFSVMIHGTKLQKMLLLNALTAELGKPRNLLMYRPDSTQPPMFFRTFSGDDYKVHNNGGNSEVWEVDLAIEAEPFAIGIRRDLPTYTVNNDPSVAGGGYFDISGIVGDAPTPAFVRADTMGPRGQLILSTRSVNNPTSLSLIGQAESATLLGADTKIFSAAWTSGGSATYTDFLTNNSLTARLTLAIPNGSDPIALDGRYRVFARISSSGTCNVTVRWKQSATGDLVNGPSVSADLTTTLQYLDLGIIEYPAPQRVPERIGYSNLQPGHAAKPITIEATRNSGTGNMNIDYVVLMPADERMCCTFQYFDIPSGYIVLDGPNDATYAMPSGSSPFGSTAATRLIDNQNGIVTRIGGLPMLVPNVTQRWYTLFTPNTLGVTKQFSISYWPRWKEIPIS